MGHKYIELAFTQQVKNVQTEQNSRQGYLKMEAGEDVNYLLSQREADFIQARDSFYMASVSETDWPYVQHRGGPAGFLKVIDEKTIGFADFSGNRQYISTGNFRKNDRVSLILMDYPNRSRMKILGRVSVVADDDWDTLAQLEDDHYRARVERGFLIHIEAFDWNCPQHITPRFTEDHIQQLLAPLEQELKTLKALNQSPRSKPAPGSTLGDGPLELVVSGIRQLTPQVRAFELRHPEGLALPEVEAGAHIQLPIIMANGEPTQRYYSICSNPARRDIYEVAILRDDEGEGGSRAIHETYQLGQRICCQLPKNNFPLDTSESPAILIAGGIGITPIKAMAQRLKAVGRPLTLHYAGRSDKDMAFRDRLQREFGDDLKLYRSALNQRLDIATILKQAPADSLFYVCGPNRLINHLLAEAQAQNLDIERIRFERFSGAQKLNDQPLTVSLQRSKKVIEVKADETILDAMLASGVTLPFSCKTGVCRSCAVTVIDGEPEHRDTVLSVTDKSESGLFCPCVSRATTENLTLDV